ncbi:hypothetical protein K457DRAFT_121757 [Linnemannia elongata AG-77]|uniref:F-box domain-containing protein n=1 Tax=Linnemannia elongata AG-77 TaxID=1314771 RepID=A0A197KA84_9FUNG|nr:hypothetical protein K457DRAFT_121757 [Linnemannia elongata AG-77]
MPRASHTIRNDKRQDNPSPETNSLRTAKPTALEIPELLENIFLFIDDETINTTVIYVCHQWHLLNKHRIACETQWDCRRPLSEMEKAKSQLSRTTRLLVHLSNQSGHYQSQQILLKTLQDSRDQSLGSQPLQEQNESSTETGKETTLCDNDSLITNARPNMNSVLKGRLRELLVTGELYNSIPTLLDLQRGSMPELTRLTLDLRWYGGIYPGGILYSCPHLESLSITAMYRITLLGSWIEDSQPDRYNACPRKVRLPLPLKSLVLKNVYLRQSRLEDLLTNAPQLTELRLMVVQRWATIPPSEPYDFQRLFTLLRTLTLNLDCFHCSTVPSYQELECPLETVVEMCPNTTTWTFQGQELGLELARSLFALPNVVTTLELEYSKSDHLHYFLCESPHLLHLKALRSHIYLPRLDIFFRHKYSPPRGNTLNNDYGKVWQCRNLLTLQMAFYSIEGDAAGSRIVFGYISTVCPRLQELVICGPEGYRAFGRKEFFPMCMSLDGGMCLLARLTDLRRFRMGIYDLDIAIDRWDLDWMIGTDNLEELRRRKEKRSKVVAGWSWALKKERMREKTRHLPRYEDGATINERVDEGLRDKLQRLGLLEDVALEIQKMDSDPKFICWPRLQWLSMFLDSGFGQSPEREVERVLKNRLPPSLLDNVRTMIGW